ncbi:AsmA-like C-terminal region-containing protein [Desertivirga xinjiangensis]|uniref:AsmA-like C-terminal region-containing protein n=1 Tax=Desertivirga xinjiangensis TaxID=539206 RepID=UPI00210EAFE9|nr:AsmA-like C-terminal region-containing protein [Pedobacter xinjiangensis]
MFGLELFDIHTIDFGRTMNRPLKITLIIIGTILGLVALIWLGVAAYVTTHREKVLNTITAQLNENITGVLAVEKMEPSLIRGFPGVSVSLKNVLLKDSLFDVHGHNLLKAKEVFVSVNAFSIITGKPNIQTIRIDDGDIYLYTDSSGYRNTQLFRSTTASSGNSRPKRRISGIYLNRVRVTLDNKFKGKLFSFDVHQLSAKLKYKRHTWIANVKLKSFVKALAFNIEKGSYLKDKMLQTKLNMEYDHRSHILSIPLQEMIIDKDKLKIGGNFSFAPYSSNFILNIEAPSLSLSFARTLLTPGLSGKLSMYNLEKPIEVNALIKGRLKGKNIPLINIKWNVVNNTLMLPGETITNCSFKGSFSNEFQRGQPRTDPNSIVSIYKLKGKWSGIGFQADTVKVWNLQKPIIEGRFSSDFQLSKLNTLTASETFNITKGRARLNLLYRAPFAQNAEVEPYIFGSIRINDAGLIYVPRGVRFANVSGLVEFKGQHLFLRNMKMQSGSTKLDMYGSVLDFVNLYYSNPGKMLLDWHVQSPRINLGEFVAFLGARSAGPSVRNSRSGIRKVFGQLNNVLNQANVKVELQAHELLYKRFLGSDAYSSLSLNQSNISLNRASLRHAGGSLDLKGNIDQGSSVNKFALDATLKNVDIRKLFYAFENFGQSGISYENLIGKLSARAKVRGLIRNTGQTVPKSFFGKVSFNLQQGALINYEPMEKIGNFAFRKRNFSNITLNSLSNELDIRGDKVYIPRMVIQSSVLNLIVEGVYGIPTGTNISLSIPIRNPGKDVFLSDSLKEKRLKRGIVINLNAVDGEDGRVKFKLGKSNDDDDDDAN